MVQKAFLYFFIIMLLAFTVFATHNKLPTGPNGNYRPEFDFAYFGTFNEAYPDAYEPDPFSRTLKSRYCDYGYIGGSSFGTPVGDRCSSRYGRYGQFGKFGEFSSFSNAGIRTVDAEELGFDTMKNVRRYRPGIFARRTSSYYPDVQQMPETGFTGRSRLRSRHYPALDETRDPKQVRTIMVAVHNSMHPIMENIFEQQQVIEAIPIGPPVTLTLEQPMQSYGGYNYGY